MMLVGWFLDLVTLLILAAVIMSWVAPRSRHPAAVLLRQLTEPLFAPIRRALPDMGGLDFSPMLLLLLIQFIRRMLII